MKSFTTSALAVAALAAAPAFGANIAPGGSAFMGVGVDGVGTSDTLHNNDVLGAAALAELNDGISGTPGASVVINGGAATAADGNGTDTWAGAIPEVGNEFDFVGVMWSAPVMNVTQLSVQHFLANDGGWFGPTTVVAGGAPLTAADLAAPTLQVTSDGGTTWVDVATTNDYVSQLTGNVRGTGFPDGTTAEWATFDFAAQNGINGIRLVGNGAGNAGGDANGFIAVHEIAVEGVIPEPGSLALLGLGGLLIARRRRG